MIPLVAITKTDTRRTGDVRAFGPVGVVVRDTALRSSWEPCFSTSAIEQVISAWVGYPLPMVRSSIEYAGGLRTRVVHGPSGSVVVTDAPRDNHGLGEGFSPTDLLATSLATCMVTVMGISARQHALDIDGMTAEVDKHMSSEPRSSPCRKIKWSSRSPKKNRS